MRQKTLLVLLCMVCVLYATAQDLTVRNMESLPFDTYASVHKRLDLNQNPCAVVRVSLPVSGATFSGNVIGDVSRDGSDYLVYMPAGSKKIWVKHPNYHELEVVFGKYGIERLESLATYRVTVNVPQKGMGNDQDDGLTYFVLSVEPKTAQVTIDGNLQSVDPNGEYSVLLSRSSHTYSVSAGGYATRTETFVLGLERKSVKVTLESTMASLSVTSATKGAVIYVNELRKGTDKWSGSLQPGNYKVEARLDGYYPQSETVTLAASEEKRLTLPALMARTGSLNVSYKPNDSEVWIDGRRAGLSPDIFKDLSLGSHKVSIRKEGYATKDLTATISENQTATLSGTLEQISATPPAALKPRVFTPSNTSSTVAPSTKPSVGNPSSVTLTVSGHVRNHKEPMIGVAIISDGKIQSGAVTDIDGNYSIQNISPTGTITYSYVGYKQQRINVKGRTSIDVTLHENYFNNAPIVGISLVSDFKDFPIGVKGDILWGLIHLGIDASVGSVIFSGTAFVHSSITSSFVNNGQVVEPVIEFIGSEDEKTYGTFAYTITPGFFYKYMSLDCGLGQIFTQTSRIDNYKYMYNASSVSGNESVEVSSSLTTVGTKQEKVTANKSYFVYKPGITAVIGDTDAYAFIMSARYRLCPAEKTMNGFELSLGMTFAF